MFAFGVSEGRTKMESTCEQWFSIPEYFLATCSNGEVFSDNSGRYTAFRDTLLFYYPKDVRLKKMAVRCVVMAQSGQYNLKRCLRREDRVAAVGSWIMRKTCRGALFMTNCVISLFSAVDFPPHFKLVSKTTHEK